MINKISTFKKMFFVLQQFILIFCVAILISGCGKVAKMEGEDIYAKQIKTCLDKTNNADECKE